MGRRPKIEFPRVVYGPAGATARINSEDERPDGFFNTPQQAHYEHVDDHAKAAAAVAAADRREAARKVLDDEGVKYAPNTKTTTLETRVTELAGKKAAMRAELDAHDVAYDEGLNFAGLLELTEKLAAHLASQGASSQ